MRLLGLGRGTAGRANKGLDPPEGRDFIPWAVDSPESPATAEARCSIDFWLRSAKIRGLSSWCFEVHLWWSLEMCPKSPQLTCFSRGRRIGGIAFCKAAGHGLGRETERMPRPLPSAETCHFGEIWGRRRRVGSREGSRCAFCAAPQARRASRRGPCPVAFSRSARRGVLERIAPLRPSCGSPPRAPRAARDKQEGPARVSAGRPLNKVGFFGL